jgi:hypothetical protein
MHRALLHAHSKHPGKVKVNSSCYIDIPVSLQHPFHICTGIFSTFYRQIEAQSTRKRERERERERERQREWLGL